MRETITIFICAVIFIVALQTGLVRTGLDYETLKNDNQNLKTTNERLTAEVAKVKNGGEGSPLTEQDNEAMKATMTELEQSLSGNIEKGEAEIYSRHGRPVIKLYEKTLFDGKTGALKEEGKKILLKITAIFSKFPDDQMAVIAYTNTGKIGAPWNKWASSHRWLGALQAAMVADWVQKEAGVDPARLLVSSYGYGRPSVKNNSASNRRKNQFLEVTLAGTDLQALEQARAILNQEKLPPLPGSPVLIPDQSAKNKNNVRASAEPAPEATQEEAIGEEALDKMDENAFGAGYDSPDQSQ